MSHNAKYYTKRLRPKDANGLTKISDAFKKQTPSNRTPVSDHQTDTAIQGNEKEVDVNVNVDVACSVSVTEVTVHGSHDTIHRCQV